MVKSSIRPGPVATLLSGVALTCLAGAVLAPGVAAAGPMPVQPVVAVAPLPASPDGGDSGDDDYSVDCSDGGCKLNSGPSFSGGGDVHIDHADKVNIDNADIDHEPEDSPGLLGGIGNFFHSLFGGGGSAEHGDKADRGDHADAGLSKDDVEELLEEHQDQLSKQLPPMPQSVQGGGPEAGGGAPEAGGGAPVDEDGIKELVENFVDDLLKLVGVN